MLLQSMRLYNFTHLGLESNSPSLEPGLVLGVLARSLQHEEQYRTQVPSHLSPISKVAANCQSWQTYDQGPREAEPDSDQINRLADGGCSNSLRFGMSLSCSKRLSSGDLARPSRSTCNACFTNIGWLLTMACHWSEFREYIHVLKKGQSIYFHGAYIQMWRNM